MGGVGGRSESGRTLCDYLAKATGLAKPTICVISTPSADNPSYEPLTADLFSLPCSLNFYRVFQEEGPADTRVIEDADAVLVVGGNTVAELAIWRAYGVDEVLRSKWRGGGILGGWSAGSLCWFEGGITDSLRQNELLPLHDGLSFLKGSDCPHYSSPQRRTAYENAISSGSLPAGYGVDDDAALHFDGDGLRSVIRLTETATAHHVSLKDGTIVDKELDSSLFTK